MREAEADIIHFQWLPVPMIDGRYLPKLRRIAPLVLTLHNTTTFHGSLAQRLHQGIGFGSIFQHLSGLIVHTEFSKRVVIVRGMAAGGKNSRRPSRRARLLSLARSFSAVGITSRGGETAGAHSAFFLTD